MISATTGQPGQAENQVPYPHQRVIPITVPVRSILLGNQCNAYGSVIPPGTMPPVFCTKSGWPPVQSPASSGQQEPPFQVNQTYPFNPDSRSSQQRNYLIDQTIHNASDQMEQKKSRKIDAPEDRHFSSATEQSGSGSFCNGSLSRFNSINSGSNGNGNTVSVMKAAADSGNEATLVLDGNCHRSMQREAALTKFRLKRKDRCYEKKVYDASHSHNLNLVNYASDWYFIAPLFTCSSCIGL